MIMGFSGLRSALIGSLLASGYLSICCSASGIFLYVAFAAMLELKMHSLKSSMVQRISVLSIKEIECFFFAILRNCTNLVELKKTHAHIIKFSLSQSNYLATKMVDVCSGCANMVYANWLFKQVFDPNLYLFNAMIRAYTHNHTYDLAIAMYKQMVFHPLIFPDEFTFPFVIKSCSGLLLHDLGKQVHAQIWKIGPNSNHVMENSLLAMYVKCNNLADARKLFDEMPEKDAIAWNCLLSGHARIGQMKHARAMFNEMPQKTTVSWTAMISGYTQIGCYGEALDFFWKMQKMSAQLDDVTILSVLPACAHLGALEAGKWIHFYADKNGFMKMRQICNALIEMYIRCGCLDRGWELFNQMPEKDVISWSTMILGFANHGKAQQAIELFEAMQKSKIKPNAITFLGVLSACSHAGLWNEGLNFFHSMKRDFRVDQEIEHYGCLIDLLGRTGNFDQALDIIKTMPMKPDSKIWGSLLSSSRIHSNLEIANIAMNRLMEFEPDDAGNYVLLANIYADLRKWDGMSRIRRLMRTKNMKKTPGCSMIEVNNMVQEFLSSDISKPFTRQMLWMIELLSFDSNGADESDITILEN